MVGSAHTEELKARYNKQILLCGLIKSLSYEDAVAKASECIDKVIDLDAFDASYVLAVVFDKPKEKALMDILELRKNSIDLTRLNHA